MKELSFSYLSPREIMSTEQMLKLGTHALKVISNHYVVTSIIGTPDKHDCPIHEILYDDIVSYGTSAVKEVYQQYKNSLYRWGKLNRNFIIRKKGGVI